MLIVHATAKLLARVGKPTVSADTTSTTALGSWYTTALLWRPQVALFVNETTLLPVLLPLAPARDLLDRFPVACAQTLQALNVNQAFIDHELREMSEHHLAKTANRSVLGMVNEFAWLAEAHTERTAGPPDLLALSLKLAGVPCGPLRQRTGFPDQEVAAVVAAFAG